MTYRLVKTVLSLFLLYFNFATKAIWRTQPSVSEKPSTRNTVKTGLKCEGEIGLNSKSTKVLKRKNNNSPLRVHIISARGMSRLGLSGEVNRQNIHPKDVDMFHLLPPKKKIL